MCVYVDMHVCVLCMYVMHVKVSAVLDLCFVLAVAIQLCSPAMEPVPLDCQLFHCLLVRGVFDATASRLAIFTGDSAVLCLFTKQDRREANLRSRATTQTTRLSTFDLRCHVYNAYHW